VKKNVWSQNLKKTYNGISYAMYFASILDLLTELSLGNDVQIS